LQRVAVYVTVLQCVAECGYCQVATELTIRVAECCSICHCVAECCSVWLLSARH